MPHSPNTILRSRTFRVPFCFVRTQFIWSGDSEGLSDCGTPEDHGREDASCPSNEKPGSNAAKSAGKVFLERKAASLFRFCAVRGAYLHQSYSYAKRSAIPSLPSCSWHN